MFWTGLGLALATAGLAAWAIYLWSCGAWCAVVGCRPDKRTCALIRRGEARAWAWPCSRCDDWITFAPPEGPSDADS